MKRFTGHKEAWGGFVDVKVNAPELVPKNSDKFKDKSILLGSVCDPYQPVERKYEITRKILERLISLQPHLEVMTKSRLVVRDVDLFKQFNSCVIAISISTLDDKFRKRLNTFLNVFGLDI